MKKLLISILEKIACKHEWECALETIVRDGDDRYTSLTYICTKCGKFKRWRSSK